MVKSYITIDESSQGIYKEKGSKFLAYAFPVDDAEAVKNYINDLKKKYYDARHHCYAYLIGVDQVQVRANDDGEPNHSAGDPILGQIRSFDLTNVLIVVVRYFGGTKLGVSGLINAYKAAAQEALKNAKVIEVLIKKDLEIIYNYEQTNELMRIINEYKVEIVAQKFTESCLLQGRVDPDRFEQLRAKLALLKIEV